MLRPAARRAAAVAGRHQGPAAARAAAPAGPGCRPYSPEPPTADSIATAPPLVGERLAALETNYKHVSIHMDKMEVKVDRIMDGHTPYQEAQAATLKSLQDMMQRIAEGDTPYQKARDGKLDGIAADVQVLKVWRTRVVAISAAAAALFASAGAYLKHFM